MIEDEIQNKQDELMILLEQWQAGIIDEREVHERAESIMDEFGELPTYPDNDPNSIPVEVLLNLDALNHQLITKEDIPAIKDFLRTPLGYESQGWAMWRRYWNNLDIETRKQQLQSNPYYCI